MRNRIVKYVRSDIRYKSKLYCNEYTCEQMCKSWIRMDACVCVCMYHGVLYEKGLFICVSVCLCVCMCVFRDAITKVK